MQILGAESLPRAELERELAQGGRFVFFEYCISLIFVTLRKPSTVYFLRADQSGLVRGLPYTALSLLLGWWGLPWGLIYTPITILTNVRGGCDVTNEVLLSLRSPDETASQLRDVLGERALRHPHEVSGEAPADA